MSKPRFAERYALQLLDGHGIAAIWDTHVAAAAAYGLGKLNVAASLTEIAEAAEQEWMRRGKTPVAS